MLKRKWICRPASKLSSNFTILFWKVLHREVEESSTKRAEILYKIERWDFLDYESKFAYKTALLQPDKFNIGVYMT